MDRARAVEVSKLLSFALRHDPGAVGLVLDPAGWVPVDRVLVALSARLGVVTREELVEVVALELQAGSG